MQIYKIILKSSTAFFRNEVTCTSVQETFHCPPLSTIHGLIAAAYGEYRYDIDIGFFFEFEYKTTDFELVTRQDNAYKERFHAYIRDDRFDRNDILRGCLGTVPLKREILCNCRLVLYLKNRDIAMSFERPYYALALGRLEDLVSVCGKPREFDMLSASSPVRFGKTIVPFSAGRQIPGRITKLNIRISDSNPRKVMKAGIYNIVDDISQVNDPDLNLYYDPEEDLGVYIHKGSGNV